MNRSIQLAVACVMFVFGASQAHANLILNGSFEDSTGGLPDNWNPTGHLKVVSSQGETDGINALAFSFDNQPSTGIIFQTFNTTTGTTYDLNFDFGKYSINQPLQSARLDVDVFDGAGFSGSQLLDLTVVDGTPGSGDPNSTDSADVYSAFKFSFIAGGSSSTIRFTDVSDAQTSGGGFDAMLDNVTVSAVPEPSSFALLDLGFTVIGTLRFGRRKNLTHA